MRKSSVGAWGWGAVRAAATWQKAGRWTRFLVRVSAMGQDFMKAFCQLRASYMQNPHNVMPYTAGRTALAAALVTKKPKPHEGVRLLQDR